MLSAVSYMSRKSPHALVIRLNALIVLRILSDALALNAEKKPIKC